MSEAKVKSGVFDGPQRQITESKGFPKKLTRTKEAVWNSFDPVVRDFLGNQKAEDYVELVETLVKNYGKMGCCCVFLDVHILEAHLSKTKENMGAYSEEQGERLLQGMLDFERRHVGSYDENMKGDYIWGRNFESDLQYYHESQTNIHL